MKAIRISEERQSEILPKNIKDTDVLSENAKKTLATIMNYYIVLNIVKTSGFLVCPNTVLRESVGINMGDLQLSVQELIESNLIERTVGKRRTKGEKGTASEYRVKWENLTKQIKRKNTFEELFSEYLKSSETSTGIANTNTDTNTDSNTDTNTNSNIDTNSDSNIDTNSDSETDTYENIEEEKNINTSNYFQEFKSIVDKELNSEEEIELLVQRTYLSKLLEKKRIELGGTVYNRCSSYLSRRYEEAVASTM